MLNFCTLVYKMNENYVLWCGCPKIYFWGKTLSHLKQIILQHITLIEKPYAVCVEDYIYFYKYAHSKLFFGLLYICLNLVEKTVTR